MNFTYKEHKVEIVKTVGHGDFPFFDAYLNSKWLTCGWEDILDIEGKVQQLIDTQEAEGVSQGTLTQLRARR